MRLRERPRAPSRDFLPPLADTAERTLSALAGILFLASWAVAYVALVPPDAPRHRAHLVRCSVLETGAAR